GTAAKTRSSAVRRFSPRCPRPSRRRHHAALSGAFGATRSRRDGCSIAILRKSGILTGRSQSARARGESQRLDARYISTSFVERQNLTMRMSMWRFTRLTNAFSKKLDNHKAAVALYLMWYNFARIHQTLRVTPAMEAGVTDHVWSAEEIARLAD